jgi:hypothetical protein
MSTDEMTSTLPLAGMGRLKVPSALVVVPVVVPFTITDALATALQKTQHQRAVKTVLS